MASTAENYVQLFQSHAVPLRPSVLSTRPSYTIHNSLIFSFVNPSALEVVSTWLNFGIIGLPYRLMRCAYGPILMGFDVSPVANLSFTPVTRDRIKPFQPNAIPSIRTLAFAAVLPRLELRLLAFPTWTITTALTQISAVFNCVRTQNCPERGLFTVVVQHDLRNRFNLE